MSAASGPRAADPARRDADSPSGPGAPASPRRPSQWSVLGDLASVLVFAAIGSGSHNGVDLAATGRVALPFLVAALAMWLLPVVRTRPWGLWPAGVVAWAGTSILGLGLRVALGDGISGAMPWISAATLAVLMLGWRLVAGLVRRRRSTRA